MTPAVEVKTNVASPQSEASSEEDEEVPLAALANEVDDDDDEDGESSKQHSMKGDQFHTFRYKRAVKNCSRYNVALNNARPVGCADLQTWNIHLPRREIWRERDEPHTLPSDPYPVTVLPGQFVTKLPSHFEKKCRENLAEYMKLLPFGTTSRTAVSNRQPTIVISDDKAKDNDHEDDALEMDSADEAEMRLLLGNAKGTHVQQPLNMPGSCFKCNLSVNASSNPLLACAKCGKIAHTQCHGLPPSITGKVTSYAWMCVECKTCDTCGKPGSEDKFLLCDECDRGHHSFCVGLKEIPSGEWKGPCCSKHDDTDASQPPVKRSRKE